MARSSILNFEMASNTRSGRRPAVSIPSSTQFDAASLSNIERLLLAQVVHEVGANAWSNVSKILSKHPLISRPKSFFNAQVSPKSSKAHPRLSQCIAFSRVTPPIGIL